MIPRSLSWQLKKKKKKDVNTRLDDSEAIYIIFNIKDEAINKRREGIEQMKEERHGEGSTKGWTCERQKVRDGTWGGQWENCVP